MTDNKWVDLTVLTSWLASVNWGSVVSITVGVLAGVYYVIRISKELRGKSN